MKGINVYETKIVTLFNGEILKMCCKFAVLENLQFIGQKSSYLCRFMSVQIMILEDIFEHKLGRVCQICLHRVYIFLLQNKQ